MTTRVRHGKYCFWKIYGWQRIIQSSTSKEWLKQCQGEHKDSVLLMDSELGYIKNFEQSYDPASDSIKFGKLKDNLKMKSNPAF